VFSTAGTVAATETRIVAALPDDVRRRHERAGERLGLGAVVAEAVERVDALARRTTAASDVAGSVLTPRQREIADLVAAGLTNKQIASTLAISRLTVETHVRNILERLGALSRAQIAAWAVTAARTTRT
jgi:non-specific serine/threonine protein kinase